jgi:L-gulonolactone oxidase
LEKFISRNRQYSCQPTTVYRPEDARQAERHLQDAAQRGANLRAVGSFLSPNQIALSQDAVIALDRMDKVIRVDRMARQITVQAGATLRQISEALDRQGLALPVLGSISEQRIAGAIATATHGTGVAYPPLSGLVREIELVTPGHGILRLAATRDRDFDAVRVHVGSLGVVTEVTLDVCEAFDLDVTEGPAPLADVLERLPQSLHTDHYRFWYIPYADIAWEWTGRRVEPGGRPRSQGHMSPASFWRDRVLGHYGFEALLYLSASFPNLLPKINRWHSRLQFSCPRTSRGRSDQMFNMDCLHREFVSEWAIPVDATPTALKSLQSMADAQPYPMHLPIEVRFVRRDDAWLSPTYGRDCCYIGIINYIPYGRVISHDAYFHAFEDLMLQLGGRPHWAKSFRAGHEILRDLYPKWDDFQKLRETFDPRGVMYNSYTERVLGPVSGEPVQRAL